MLIIMADWGVEEGQKGLREGIEECDWWWSLVGRRLSWTERRRL